jgi:medium-chain acyl-[acyl-carrier-protein] hydrolase
MESIYVQNFKVDDILVDRYGRMKPSAMLYIAQVMSGRHSDLMRLDYDSLASRHLFWAVIRNRVQISRAPLRDETIRVETWPLPATRAAFPRSVVAYDEQGNELFRCMTLWVLMDLDTRRMIPPGKSGIMVVGTHRDGELPAPAGLIPCPVGTVRTRTVNFTDLDRNGHMNNTRCMDWIADVLPSSFHEHHSVTDFTVCYLAEAQEGQEIQLNTFFAEDGTLQADAMAAQDGQTHRVFSAKLLLENLP